LTDVNEMLKVARPKVEVIAAEPVNAAMLKGEEWHPHKTQGWTPDLVPMMLNQSVSIVWAS
jgi:cysteine synthase A